MRLSGAREGAETVDQAVEKTYGWSKQKRMFRDKHIKLAWDILERKGWLRKQG
jgi:hypothetical protein